MPFQELSAEPSGCANLGQDCRASRCCNSVAHHCFEKDDTWAACLPQCAPGEHADDPKKYRTPWTCKLLDEPPELKDKFWMMCSGSGDCAGSRVLHKWRTSPRVLADQVGDLSRLPGAHRADHPVLEHWRASPPTFHGNRVELRDIALFVRELLSSDPFGTGDEVPYVDFEGEGEAQVVAVTQRQLAFLVANALMGNGIPSGDGLEAALQRCAARGMPDARWFIGENESRALDEEHRGSVLFRKRRLRGEGPFAGIAVAVGRFLQLGGDGSKGAQERPEEHVVSTSSQAATTTHRATTATTTPGATTTTATTTGPPPPTGFLFSLLSFLAVLSQELADGRQGSVVVAARPRAAEDSWRDKLADHLLKPPTMCLQSAGGADCGLNDFMAGGTDFQAMTDIAGGAIGGGAGLCDIATTQEESVVQFYSEVLAFSFFAGGPTKMLPVPVVFLGARRYMAEITGQSGLGPPFFAKCGYIRAEDWLNDGIAGSAVQVKLAGRAVPMAASSFVGVASKCARCHATCSIEDLANNRCAGQRQFLEEDVGRWYQAYEASMYHSAVRGAFRGVVRRIGTGPWGAGDWMGDSQRSFLAVWLATSLLDGVSLDYYAYSRFCENPANQCLVLGAAACRKCLDMAYPWPGTAGKVVSAASCGGPGLGDVVARLQWKPAEVLHGQLMSAPQPPTALFASIMGR